MNTEIAKVIDAIGGVGECQHVAHCATRLRVMVKDEAKSRQKMLSKTLEKYKVLSLTPQILNHLHYTVNKIYDEAVALGHRHLQRLK